MALTIRSIEKIPGIFILYPVGRMDSNSYANLEKKVDYRMRERQAKSLST